MKAITQDRYGGPESLSFTDVDRPEPAAGEVLVRVRAAAVNAADWHVMRGDPYVARIAAPAVFGRRGPRRRIRGRDVAGVVEALGTGVTDLRVGDAVFGDLGLADGAFAEFVAAPAELFAPAPASLSFEQAAAVPLAGGTALAALRDAGGLQAGQRVLVNGASGGVGTFAVQIAVALGAEVTAVCSARNVDQVRELGAHRVLDYRVEDFAHAPVRHHVVLDLVGNRTLRHLRRALIPDGTLVLSGGGVSRGGSVVGPMGLMMRAELVNRFVAHRLCVFSVTPGRELLADLRDLIDAGRVTPRIERTFPLSATADAVRHLETEHARGKIVITVA
jgi:NADPH:quinone reductase-like Zn-dependent oxidoreductase